MPAALPRIPRTAADVGAVAKAGDTMTGPLVLSGAPTSALHAASKAYVDVLAIVPATTVGSLSTVQDDATRTANTTAINAAITAAQVTGNTVVLKSFCWADVGVTANGAAVRLVGEGFHTGIGTIDASGTLLDMKVTSGYAIAPTGMTLFGPCEYIPTNEYPGGTIPTTYTTVLLEVGRTSTSAAQHLRLQGMHLLGGYDCVRLTNCTMALVSGNIMQHGRRSCLYIDNPQSSDNGDTIIADNWFHVANSGSPGYSASVTCAIQVDACSGLYIERNKVYMRSDVGFNINLAHSTYDDATAPQIKHIIEGNFFDSGGLVAGSHCVKVRSAWGSGGTGTAVTGNRLSGLTISRNVLHNCANLCDISSYSGGITNIDIAGNVAFGGGGITLAGTIDRIRITGNTFDDGGWTGSYGPAKPITSTATITNGSYYGNEWIGFGSAADLVDETSGTTVDTSPACVELADGATITVTCDPERVVHSHRVVLGGNRTITWDVAGADQVLEGMRGSLWVIQDATGSRTVTWTAPTGIEAIRWKGNSAPTLTTTAHAYDLIRWEVVATENGLYLMLEAALNFGTVTPPVVGGFTLTSLSSNTWLYAFDPNVGVYDADTGGTEVTGTNDASVGRIVDNVDGSVAAAQATAGNRPTLKTNVLNSKPVIQLDGGDYLTFTLEAARSRPYTIFVVMKTTATDSNTTMRYVMDATGGDFRLRLRPDSTGTVGTSHRFQFGDEIANGYIYPTTDYVNNTWRIVTGVADASGSLRVGGASIGTGNAGNNLAGTETIYLGIDNGGTLGMIGQIAFIGIQAGSDATDIANTEADLATYFGL